MKYYIAKNNRYYKVIDYDAYVCIVCDYDKYGITLTSGAAQAVTLIENLSPCSKELWDSVYKLVLERLALLRQVLINQPHGFKIHDLMLYIKNIFGGRGGALIYQKYENRQSS